MPQDVGSDEVGAPQLPRGTSSAYIPGRDARFHYASDVAEHIEFFNCTRGDRSPCEAHNGGSCPLLINLFTETPTPEFQDHRSWIECTAYAPTPVEPPQVEVLPLEGL